MLHGALLRSPVAHARIVSIDTSAALQHPRVHAVITGADLEPRGMAWMPTLSSDTQAVLATDKVRFQGQEVAFVIADDRYSARDALELIDVEYDVLEPVVDARRALDPDAPLVRDDLAANHVFDWEAGDAAATAEAFARAEVIVEQELRFPRSHPAPMETCGAVASFDRVDERLTLWCTTQAPHAHRTLYALITGLPEHRIRVISPDVGGGFGNKVPIYPGYVCALVGAMLVGRPVKWMEDRSENLMSTGFARDYAMKGRIAATREGRILAVDVDVLADHGAFNAAAQPTRYPAGFFSVFTGSYDIEAAHCSVSGVYTNKAPGGIAYACSFRIAEAVYLVERIVDCLAQELGMDPVELRLRNLLKPEQFPYATSTGWVYDSGDYERALRLALEIAGYDELRREQAEKRARGELMGIGVSCFTEAVGAGPRKHMDMMGLGMNDGAALRVSPTGTAQLAISVQTQGQGHETTFAQIVAEELGIPPEDVEVVHGDTDTTPYGLGTYGSRSTPVSGAATALAARKVRDRARVVAGAMLEVAPEDLEWQRGRWSVKGDPDSGASIRDIAMAARGAIELPEGVEAGLDAEAVYDPPNLTFPFGAYVCVVDVDPGTAHVSVRRFIAVDDCGVRINPMIVEGQIHGGLTDGVGMALMEQIAFDEDGNCLGGSLMDYLIPTAVEVPDWETGETVTPSPHHPIGAKGIGESATVGSPPAIVNAICDALGVRHVDMPCTPSRVWHAMRGAR
jgi:carbon-monoxide dehydrogenase large subunit